MSNLLTWSGANVAISGTPLLGSEVLPRSTSQRALDTLKMLALHKMGGSKWALVLMAIELLIVIEMVASLVGARAERRLISCSLASAPTG